MEKQPSDWIRVEKGMPCPICGKKDWCLVSTCGKKVICPRVKSNIRLKNSGFLHKVFDNGLKKGTKPNRKRSNQRINWKSLNKLYKSKLRKLLDKDGSIGLDIGITLTTLAKFDLGWDGETYTFPAYNGTLQIVGIMRRFPDGKKLWVSRSGDGLFIPKMKSFEGNIFITEGVTDAAALVDYGFRAMGRANCQTGVAYIKNFLYNHPKISQVTIVGDNDPNNVHGNIGQRGAFTLAKELYKATPFTAILEVPEQFKDVRLWLTENKVSKDEIIDEVHRYHSHIYSKYLSNSKMSDGVHRI